MILANKYRIKQAAAEIGFFALLLTFPVFIMSCSQPGTNGVSYYFDSAEGNNENSGTSPEKPFQSLVKIRELALQPGDKILLKSGSVFTEQLYFSGKGDSLNPVEIGKYGGDALPHIKGDGKTAAVHILNSEYFVLRDLEISNKGETPVEGLNGLLVELNNYGIAKNIVIENLFVHGVTGSLVKEKGGGDAIHFVNYHDDKPDTVLSCFDGLLVQNCHVKDCQRNGIMMWGNWIRSKWFPSRNVIIRNNLIEGVPGDGIVPVGCESPLVEYNIMRDCPGTLPTSEACDGIWPWSCDNAVIQYNIVDGHKSVVDGYGFDSDWNSANSLFQYNLSMNNDGGFMLICNSGGWPADWSIGNTGTRVQFNLSINDGIRNYIPANKTEYFSALFHVTGPVFNTVVEKNLFYVVKKEKPEIDKTFVHLSSWTGYADSTAFRNNFLFLAEPHKAVLPGKSTRNFFEGNIFSGELSGFETGFQKAGLPFNSALWYDENDEGWIKLVDFVKDKTITIEGREYKITDLIGYTEKQ